MSTLFNITPNYPEGFSYYPNFISGEEEKSLCKNIQELQLHTFSFQGYTANRKVASFGYDYSFENGALTKGQEIPTPFLWVVDKVAAHLQTEPTVFAELLVTEYPVGSVINWHRDAPPFDIIAGISLMADCIFKLRPQAKEKQGRSATISIPVARRSLYIIEGPARSEWQHSIAPVKQKRYSITLRTLR